MERRNRTRPTPRDRSPRNRSPRNRSPRNRSPRGRDGRTPTTPETTEFNVETTMNMNDRQTTISYAETTTNKKYNQTTFMSTTTTSAPVRRQRPHSGIHPSLVAGLTLFFIVLILVLIIIIKCCHSRQKRLKKQVARNSSRISSYKLYSEVDRSVFLVDKSSCDGKSFDGNMKGPEHDSIDEYLKRSNENSYEGIELDDSKNESGKGEFKYDYATSPAEVGDMIEHKYDNATSPATDADMIGHKYDYVTSPATDGNMIGQKYDYATQPAEKGDMIGKKYLTLLADDSDMVGYSLAKSDNSKNTDDDGYFVLEKQSNIPK